MRTKTFLSFTIFVLAIAFDYFLFASGPSDSELTSPSDVSLKVTVGFSDAIQQLTQGTDVRIYLEICNIQKEPIRLFNPFLSALLPLPVELRIYNSKVELVGKLNSWTTDGSRRLPNQYDYVFLPPETGTRATWHWAAATIPSSLKTKQSAAGESMLPPGKYFLEAVCCRGLTTFSRIPPDNITGAQMGQFYDSFDQTDWIKSNMVSFEIISSSQAQKTGQED